MHDCPNPECEAKVPVTMLACRKDWYRLPRGLRNRIWNAWDDGAGAGSPEHAAVIREAVQWYRDNPQPPAPPRGMARRGGPSIGPEDAEKLFGGLLPPGGNPA